MMYCKYIQLSVWSLCSSYSWLSFTHDSWQSGPQPTSDIFSTFICQTAMTCQQHQVAVSLSGHEDQKQPCVKTTQGTALVEACCQIPLRQGNTINEVHFEWQINVFKGLSDAMVLPSALSPPLCCTTGSFQINKRAAFFACGANVGLNMALEEKTQNCNSASDFFVLPIVVLMMGWFDVVR